jgi:hypothetical protein
LALQIMLICCNERINDGDRSWRSVAGKGNLDMKKISHSKDVDALLIELSNEPIAYAEEEGAVILHYSQSNKLVLVEILDFRRFML